MEEKTIKILIWTIVIILYFVLSAYSKKKKVEQSQIPPTNRKNTKEHEKEKTPEEEYVKQEVHRPISNNEFEETDTLEKIINENEDRNVLGNFKVTETKYEEKYKPIFTKSDLIKSIILSDIIKPKYF
ncbi:MAG: hypothetical protein N3A01_02365 [Bacteroidales bacterium]|nr:hypothetical protein [Bacteroidales bacterium]